MEPFKNLGMTTLTIRNTGGTDHLSFDAVGLPGFQFIQDEVEYDTRTHHSNMDVYERIQAERHDAQRGHRRVVRATTRRTATRSCRASRCRSRRRRPAAGRAQP